MPVLGMILLEMGTCVWGMVYNACVLGMILLEMGTCVWGMVLWGNV